MAVRKIGKATPGPKKVTVDVIGEDENPGIYRQMLDLVARCHPHLAEARIAIAWNTAWKADADDHLRLGQAKKAADLERDMHRFDLVILLNRQAWDEFDGRMREALLDHELSHFAVSQDNETGEDKRDERGRLCYRIRRHDVEEFTDIVERHGVWKRDLETFVRAAAEAKKTPLLTEARAL
jgi:hypothetical protein